MPNSLSFLPIDLKRSLDVCIKFREDTHGCSFQNLKGLSNQLGVNREQYSQYLNSYNSEGLKHIFYNGKIIGQLEFTFMPTNHKVGYINLIYVEKSFRGEGVSGKAMNYIMAYFFNNSCEEVMLSVSRTNHRAIKYYEKHGFKFLKKNTKDPMVDIYSHIIDRSSYYDIEPQ